MDYLSNLTLGIVNLISILSFCVGVISLLLTLATYKNVHKIKSQFVSNKIKESNFDTLSKCREEFNGMISATKRSTEINRSDILRSFSETVSSLEECKEMLNFPMRKKYNKIKEYQKIIKTNENIRNDDLIEYVISVEKMINSIIAYLQIDD